MKIFISLLCSIMLPCLVYGQSVPFRLGVSIMPEFSMPLLDISNSPHSFRTRVTSTGSFGISADYSFSEKTGLYTGGIYSIKRFSVDASNIYLESNNFASETTIDETLNVNTLLIPFIMYYQFSSKWQIKGGVGFNFLIYESRYRSIFNAGDEEMKLYNNHRDFTPGLLSFQIGLHRQIESKFFQFDISPQLWLHTHHGDIPLLARTNYQMSFGLEITAWLD